MKIAYVVTRAEPIGGVQIHVRDLAEAALARGHTPTVLMGGDGPFFADLRGRGIPVVSLRHLTVPIRPASDLRALREIRRAVEPLQPDLLALHSSKAGILGRLVGRSLKIPAVLTAHGWNFTPGIAPVQATLYRQIERLAGPLATRIITVSEFDRQLAIQARITTADRIVTVYNGMPDIAPLLRAEPGRAPPRLVMVARFGAQKDHPTLFQALQGLRQHPWELDLVGEGPLMVEMQALAGSLGIADRVHFLGQRMDVERILANAQIGLLITNWEGFPLSVLEAMRAGLPVVASSVAGLVESVRDGETGYLVPRGDVAAVRSRLERLLVDPGLRMRMGAGGRACYEGNFTLERFVARTFEVYRTIVAESPAADRRRPDSVTSVTVK
ncbi:MAG TPA: glycosyltransferase family 4 protein [Gemmatimonadales bacterium]